MNICTKFIRLATLLYHFKTKAAAVPAMPLRLWIESSLICNLRCVMCPNKDLLGAQKGVMSLELFKKIIDEAKGFVSDVYLHHRGEPLINQQLGAMIAYAKAQGMAVRFHTNGTLLDAAKARMLLDAAPDLVSVSFDGFEKTSYEAIRPGSHFETTVANILRFAEMKKKEGRAKPYFVIERIDFAQYRHTGDSTAKEDLARQLLAQGVDEIIVKEEYAWATEQATELTTTEMVNTCTFPWYAMVICWDGTVTPCPQDYHAALTMGDLKTQSLREIWNSQPYQRLRRQLSEKSEDLTVCRKCDRLTRQSVGGVPLQYLITFLADQFAGYGRLRRWIGTRERNAKNRLPE